MNASRPYSPRTLRASFCSHMPVNSGDFKSGAGSSLIKLNPFGVARSDFLSRTMYSRFKSVSMKAARDQIVDALLVRRDGVRLDALFGRNERVVIRHLLVVHVPTRQRQLTFGKDCFDERDIRADARRFDVCAQFLIDA